MERESTGEAANGRADKAEDVVLFCPCCSTRLTELKCKLICGKCGYFMSCADYY